MQTVTKFNELKPFWDKARRGDVICFVSYGKKYVGQIRGFKRSDTDGATKLVIIVSDGSKTWQENWYDVHFDEINDPSSKDAAPSGLASIIMYQDIDVSTTSSDWAVAAKDLDTT